MGALIEAEPRRWGIAAGQVFFCGACGQAYGRIPSGRRWQVQYGCCSTCPPEADGWVPGAIWSHFPELNALLSDAQVCDALLKHLNWFETQWRKYDFPAT